MELPQIKAFIDAMASSDLTELEVSKDGWTLRLMRGGRRPTCARRVADPLLEQPSRDNELPTETPIVAPDLCAPLSGIIYLRPSPDQPPFVVVGQAISAGATVCVIEAMKTFSEIRAERDGVVEAILVASETLVDAGQPLIRIT
jgi:acetyl-CoA carboxylase biotin carboxyl carrier protein